MSNRMRVTVLLTGLSGPIGSVLLAVVLGRWAKDSQAGMASLAVVVAGLMFGGGLLALVVFGLCLFLLVREEVARPLRAVGVMVVASVVNMGAAMVALVFAGRSGGDATVPAVVGALVSIVVLGVGAWLALKAGLGTPMIRE